MNIKELNDIQKQMDSIKRNKLYVDRLNNLDVKAIEQQRRLIDEVANQSNQRFGSIFDARNQHLRFIEDLRASRSSLNKSFLENLQGLQSSKHNFAENSIKTLLSTYSERNLINERVQDMFNQLSQNVSSPIHSNYSDTVKNFEQITKATALSIIKSLMDSFSNKSLLQHDNLLNRTFKSLNTYDQFAKDTIAKLHSERNESIASALKGSLTLANEQMLRSTSIVRSSIENLDISNFDDSNLFFDKEFPQTNRYCIQKNELIERDDINEDEDYESLIIKSPAAISFDLAVNCLKLIGICNETSQTVKGSLIFTLTNSVWSNSFRLLQIVPTNKEKFAEIVDYLYFILVEGAGKDNLRFIDYQDGKHFGYFVNTEPEVEVIWKIKHLRNKWLRHDIEHGKDGSIKRDYRIRKETLEWFGMQKVPQSKDDFIFLYNKLMLKVKEFLHHLMDRVSKFKD